MLTMVSKTMINIIKKYKPPTIISSIKNIWYKNEESIQIVNYLKKNKLNITEIILHSYDIKLIIDIIEVGLFKNNKNITKVEIERIIQRHLRVQERHPQVRERHPGVSSVKTKCFFILLNIKKLNIFYLVISINILTFI